MTRANGFINRADLPMKAPSAYHAPRQDSWLALLDAIEAKPCKTEELAARFGIGLMLVRRQLNWLRLAGIVHIEPGSYADDPVYAYGGEQYRPGPGRRKVPQGTPRLGVWGV